MKKLTTRELQAYGAACLCKFCSVKGITDPAIEQLVDHLVLVLTSEHLPTWEALGANLDLPGRGDPLPEYLSNALSSDEISQFRNLVELVVEIGMVDLYGASTDQPRKFASQVVSILERNGIDAPCPDEIFGVQTEETAPAWGSPLSETLYSRVRDWCRRTKAAHEQHLE